MSLGNRGNERLRATSKSPSAASCLLQALERGEVRADAEALDGEHLQPELSTLLVQLRTAEDVDPLAVARGRAAARRTGREASAPRGTRRSPDP